MRKISHSIAWVNENILKTNLSAKFLALNNILLSALCFLCETEDIFQQQDFITVLLYFRSIWYKLKEIDSLSHEILIMYRAFLNWLLLPHILENKKHWKLSEWCLKVWLNIRENKKKMKHNLRKKLWTNIRTNCI